MKVAVLCLCLISITVAWPVSKSKRHAISASSEEKYDSRGHRSHRQHHHHVNSQSHESLLRPRDDLASPQQTLYSSEERADVLVHPRFPGLLSKSREDPDDDVDDDDSNDTDESDEVVTDFPTDAPVTAPFPPYPFTRGDNSGRGDSVAYRIKAKATVVKSSKLHKAARKLIVHDATEEDESALVTDSHQAGLSQEDLGARHLAGKYADSGEWGHKSRGRDSNEVVRKLPDWSVENDSRQKFDSPEVERDSSERGARGGIPLSRESRESPAHVLTGVIVVDDNSNQTFESAEDVQDLRSIKNNEVAL
ncbi:osteopontin [Apteryx mantelli]|uniref:Osteopontin n=1 Tax=Apteryx mantelli TaxID=2696672 RepID=A0A8B7JP84_9AVES